MSEVENEQAATASKHAKSLESIDKARKQLRLQIGQLTDKIKAGESSNAPRDMERQVELAQHLNEAVRALASLETADRVQVRQLGQAFDKK